jgi:hypothetical protein
MIVGRGRSRVAVVMRVKLEANVGRAGVGGGGNGILWFIRDGITGGNETDKGTEFAADCSEGNWGQLCGIGRRKGGHRKSQKGGGSNDRSCWQVGQGRWASEGVKGGNSHHWVSSKEGKVGADMGRRGGGGGKEGTVGFLEAAVDVGKLEGAPIGEIRERQRGGVDWKQSEFEGGRNQQNGRKCFDDRGGCAR